MPGPLPRPPSAQRSPAPPYAGPVLQQGRPGRAADDAGPRERLSRAPDRRGTRAAAGGRGPDDRAGTRGGGPMPGPATARGFNGSTAPGFEPVAEEFRRFLAEPGDGRGQF